MSPSPKTILIVEDEASLRMVLASRMTRHGYNVVEAVTAEEGWEYLAQAGRRPDLVITDVDTPGGLSGIQMLEKLRQKEQTEGLAHIPAIVQSGILTDNAPDGTKVSRQDYVLCLPGDNRFFAKPMDMRQLTEVVNEKLGSAAPGAGNDRGSHGI